MLILNLKMNFTKDSIIDYEKYIHDLEVVILPQYIYLSYFQDGKYSLGSQDVSKYAKGSYTGEVCAKGLKDIGVKYCLVGHSERQDYFNETLLDFKMKMQNLNDHEIIPIYCISEKEEDYIKDKELKNIESSLEAIPPFTKYIVIAYEPRWLIGSANIAPDIEHINSVLTLIKSYLMERNISHSIIYGGGVNSNNITLLNNLACNDGFIISSSAIDKDELMKIYNYIKNA